MSEVSFAPVEFDAEVSVLIVGAGAAGLTAALVARSRGRDVLVVERDATPRGSTALSAGLIPAGGTRWQRAAGVVDSPAQLAADVMRKAHGEPSATLVATATDAVGPAIEWLADRHDLPFSVVTNFNYPGHSAHRMHGLPSRSGAELMDRLRQAAEEAGVDVLCSARAVRLHADAQRRVRGVTIARPDGSQERIGCKALILACNGYGGDKGLVAEHIPQMREALYFGHPGNQGDALRWGAALGAAVDHLSGHQGHGSVAHPHGVLITWATIMEGGFQVNREGLRFSDESHGYSEQAAAVLAQPGGLAVSVFDERIAAIARQFEDFRTAEAQGAVIGAASWDELAARLDLPAQALAQTAAEVSQMKAGAGRDRFGRDFTGLPDLAAPLRAVRVTGALFHTQGGLRVDGQARVVTSEGAALPNLFAAGGAACGVSGSQASGYLSGNGLMTAVALGYLAGANA